jgi:hypothetical protein
MADLRGMRKQYHFWPGESGDNLDAWDVDRLIELAQALPPEPIVLDSIAEIDSVYWFDDVHRPTVRSVAEHARLIDEVDPQYPVILGPDGRVMDGMHRIARAMRDGHRHVSAVRFAELPPADHQNVRPEDLTYERD